MNFQNGIALKKGFLQFTSSKRLIGEWLDFDATILCSLKLGNMSSQSRFAKALSKFLLWHHIFPCFSTQ